jgi:hypothetical protein
MKFFQTVFASFLIAAIVTISFPIAGAAQESKGALLRGYRTGYSDGYMAGYRDSVEKVKRDFAKHGDYGKASRVYRPEYGSLEDYRDGYQQGFESGYNTGYNRQEFNSALPLDLARRGVKTPVNTAKTEEESAAADSPVLREPQTVNASLQSGQPTIIIPANTEIIVEMLADVSTDDSKEGDSFLAKVVAPQEINGAIIEGRVAKIKRPGRVKGNAELQLTFSRVVINENRWANFNATVIEALPMKGSNIKAIDNEGTVRGKSSVKDDSVKVGAAAGTGTVIGAIAGGPVGAFVGAAIGGGAGLVGVLATRGKEINLIQGQQLRVRTNFETQIR